LGSFIADLVASPQTYPEKEGTMKTMSFRAASGILEEV
jgi:hypothetical protein